MILDTEAYKRINNLKAMAMQVVQEADELLLRFKQPAGSPVGCKKKPVLNETQRAQLLVKRRQNVARSYNKKSQ